MLSQSDVQFDCLIDPVQMDASSITRADGKIFGRLFVSIGEYNLDRPQIQMNSNNL